MFSFAFQVWYICIYIYIKSLEAILLVNFGLFKDNFFTSFIYPEKQRKKYWKKYDRLVLKAWAIPNSGLQSLKIYSCKGYRKTRSSKMNYKYVAETAILKLRIFSERYHFRLWVFASTGEYIYYWHWRLLPKCYKVQMMPMPPKIS